MSEINTEKSVNAMLEAINMREQINKQIKIADKNMTVLDTDYCNHPKIDIDTIEASIEKHGCYSYLVYKDVKIMLNTMEENIPNNIFGTVYNLYKKVQHMKWQPIETAPKDGTVVLIYHCDKFHSCFNKILMAHYSKESTFKDMWELYRSSGTEKYHEPTHWMPLPEPPKVD